MDALTIRATITDPDRAGSLADRARQARNARLLARYPDLEEMTVLDLGGTGGYWQHLGVQPRDLTIVNLVPTSGPRVIVGDACDPPPEVFDRTYDLVVCTSVIDQVGGLEQRCRLAATITEAAPAYWVQTANRWFPLDAYFLFPWFSALPVKARVAVLRRWPLAHGHTRDPEAALERVRAIELQTARSLSALFPDATVIRERFAGVTKSLIAAR